MQIKQIRLTLMLGLALSVLAGCQGYRAIPLDSGSYIDAFESRSIENASLQLFINSLDEQTRSEPFDLTDGIGMDEGELVALFYNPDLRQARLRASIDYSILENADRWDDPEFSLESVRITESVPDRWIVASSLSVTIPISGRLKAERQRAEMSVRAALSRIAEEEWATRAQLRRTWLEWSATLLKIERCNSHHASIATLVDSTDRLARAGELPATQATLFMIERMSMYQRIHRLNAIASEQELELRALMGLAPDSQIVLNPSLKLPVSFTIPEINTIAEHHPTLVRLRDEYSIAEATLRREIRKQYPDLTIGPVFESDQGQSRIGLLAGIPVPILNANIQGISQARAERDHARSAYEAQLERVIHEFASAKMRLDTTRAQRSMYESEIVPLVDRQLSDAKRLLELGESDGIVLLESLSRTWQASIELVDSRLEEALATDRLRTMIESSRVSRKPVAHNANTTTQEVQP